jgi:hypothetical protein
METLTINFKTKYVLTDSDELTCAPDKVKTFRTAPVSSFTASVMLENA